MDKKTPIILITGFLGSGKTSFIETYLRFNKGDKKVAFLVNEIGDVSIDAKLVEGLPFQNFELNNGCICCAINEHFVEALSYLSEHQNIDLVLIETTGIANPMPIIFSVTHTRFFIDLVLCVVDALNYLHVIEESVFKDQVGAADIIILTKTEMANKSTLAITKDMLKTLNPHATVFVKGEVNFETLFDASDIEHPALTIMHVKSLNSAKHGLQTFSILPKVISIEDLEAALSKLNNIWRIKGTFRAKELGRFSLNYAFGRYSIENFSSEDEQDVIVFIGKEISGQKELVLSMLT